MRNETLKTASGEEELIERIRGLLPSAAGGRLRIGIGDDAAVLTPAPGRELVITCDQFIENAHFLRDRHPPESVGYKALARATSDVGAMGARPLVFLLSAAIPEELTGRWMDRMLSGMARASRHLGLRLAGGDTARSDGFAMSLTVLGEAKRGQSVLRSGAQPGDAIFVSGVLGAAELGLELMLRGMHLQRRWRSYLEPHLYPQPPIQLGSWLAEHRLASAMMDLSDGLSTDLTRLCKASGAGARIAAAAVPAVHVPQPLTKHAGFDSMELALHGGEDYGLLFTVPRRLAGRIPARHGKVRITRIGEITRDVGIALENSDGSVAELKSKGWDHFRRSA